MERAAGITGIDASALEQGVDFPYYIEATDRAGNVARLPKDSEFTLRVVDKTPPQLFTVTGPFMSRHELLRKAVN